MISVRLDFFYDSCGHGQIHACVWKPEMKPVGVVQIIHGIAEHIARYDDLAQQLNQHGYIVVAEDHMGHGGSIGKNGIRGYFHGGWFSAVEDSYRLLGKTKEEYPELPYILFGHSMGSFIARTILAKHPDSGICGCIICGTAWQPSALLRTALPICKMLCSNGGDKKPSVVLQNMMFGSYNKRIEHQRTKSDWLTRDDRIVDAYEADEMCGFTATAGLYRDMLLGISYIQTKEALGSMKKDLPVFFVAGGDDPVGAYGNGVRMAVTEFRNAGMQNVDMKIYPLCRHEILNEINGAQVFDDLLNWIQNKCIR